MKKTLKWNVVTGTGLYVITILVAFFMSPFLVRTLGNRDYGLWDIILSLIGYMGLLDLGMGPALVRFVAIAYADKQRLRVVISSAFFFFLTIGVVAFVSLVIISQAPDFFFGGQVKEFHSISAILFIVAVNLLIQFPGTVFVGTLLGLQRHYLVNTLQAIVVIGQALMLVTILPSMPGRGLLVLACVETAGLLFQYSIVLVLFICSSTLPRPALSYFSWSSVKEMWWFGLKNSMLMLASRLQKQSIPIIIGRVVGINTVVFFTLSNRLVEYGKGLSIAMGNPLMPYFGALSQSSDEAALRENWKKVSLAMQMVTLAMPVFLWFLGEDFLRMWIGPEYALKGKWVLRFLIIGLCAEAFSPIAGRFLVGAAKHGKAAKIWLVTTLIFIPCAIAGAYWAGLAGVALVSALATVSGSYLVLRLTCRILGITVGEHFRSTVLPLVPAILTTAVILWICSRLWTISTYPLIILVSCCALTSYVSIGWFCIRKRIFPHSQIS